ncbi:hypothetical protein, variant 2 [Verruconis gallopava]|uniref:IPT/TIG domain-containing protein n=1 Tax=Verruconis gallopava TaxID=253628 RepID=A0A0D2AI35_9PEZI|nr:uncharacterized protein PV09_09635 [Verruconis gallopava]XP_016208440.1 hypothetical protein, variant 2 [Verruconis gallopava]KIV98568.1 hypothetical protein PV09_09635 [Verruconis gallopava]KIV98570.1 hypothetical protein, variant 2 [Verruconis gallopava]
MFNSNFASPPDLPSPNANMYDVDGLDESSFDLVDGANPTFDPNDFLNSDLMSSPAPTTAQLNFGSPVIFQNKAAQSPLPQFHPRSVVSSASPESSTQDSSSDSSGRRKRKSPSESSPGAVFGSYHSQNENSWSDQGLEMARGKRRPKHDSPVMKQEDASMGMLNNSMTQSFNIKSAANSPPAVPGAPASKTWSIGTPRSAGEQDLSAMPYRTRSPATFHFGIGSRDTTPPSAMPFDSTHNTPYMMMRDSPDTDPLSFPGRTPLGSMMDGFTMFSPAPAIQTTTNMGTVRPGDIGRQQIRLHVSPLGQKSRVETQIPIKLTLDPLPAHVKKMHLPTETIAKAKFLAKETRPSHDTLELSAMLVCTSAMEKPEHKAHALQIAREGSHLKRGVNPRRSSTGDTKKGGELDLSDPDSPMNGGPVRICDNCVSRERKRAGRKKAKKQEDEERWYEYEHDRIIMFNTTEYVEFHTPTPAKEPQYAENVSFSPEAKQIDAPMRIVCYCRHQQEKIGFQVIFTIKDFQGRIVAQVMTQSILITDDHKTHTHGVSSTPGLAVVDSANVSIPSFIPGGAVQPHGLPGRAYHSSTNLAGLSSQSFFNNIGNALAQGQRSATSMTPRNLSRPASPSGHTGPKKKRKGSSGQHKIPADLMMTRSDHEPITSTPTATSTSQVMASHVSPESGNFGFDTSMSFGGLTQQNTFNTTPPTPDPSIPQTVNHEKGDNYFFSAPNSAHPSRAPSPTSFARQQIGMYSNAVAAKPNAFSGIQFGANESHPPPTMYKIRPDRGPTSGNIEVVILGKNFNRNLEVMFGDNIATATTFWNSDTLVCLLPPAVNAGAVPVTFVTTDQRSFLPPSSSTLMFTYVNDGQQSLFELAIRLQCQAQTGQGSDHLQYAQNLINALSPGNNFTGGQAGGFNANMLSTGNAEDLMLSIINKVDLIDSPFKPYYEHRTDRGSTMLAVACRLGYERLVAALLARGADPDAADVGGFTPLMLAALCGHVSIVRRLILRGADPGLRNLRGMTAAELAPTPEVRQYVRHRRHYRSVSAGSLFVRSRANSATSTRSLWGPPSSSASSTMYSTEDESALESGNEDENDHIVHVSLSALASRRQSLAALQSRRGSEISRTGADTILSTPAAVPSENAPANTISMLTALRDQMTAQINALQQNLTSMQLSDLLQEQDLRAFGRRISTWGPMMRRVPSPRSASPASSEPPPPYHEACPDSADQDFDTKPPDVLVAESSHSAFTATLLPPSSAHDSTLRQRAAAESTAGKVTIGKTSPTGVEAAELRRIRLERLTPAKYDKNLWSIWFPLLIILVTWYFSGLQAPPFVSWLKSLNVTVTESFGKAFPAL